MEHQRIARPGFFRLSAALILAALTACSQQGPPVEKNGQKSAGSTGSGKPEVVRLTVPRGTAVHITLLSGVSSATSQTGDTFTARTTDPVVVGDRVALPEGSIIHGQVSDVVPARKGLKEKGGAITLAFDKVVTPAGFSAPMSAGVSSVAPKSSKRTAGIIGGSAAGGALLGRIVGKDTGGALVGAVVGGAVGTAIAAGTKGKEVEVPAESRLTIALDQPLTIAVKP